MSVVVRRVLDRPIESVWAVVADVTRHELPLTTVQADPGQPSVGWRFVGISALGPLRVADRMTVTRWRPPEEGRDDAEYAVVKTGRVLAGWAEVVLQRGPRPGQTQLCWREEIVLHPWSIGQLVRPITDRAVRRMFERAVDRMLARA